MDMEYGGFIPFELKDEHKEFFSNYEDMVVRVNSGRTAICYAIEELNPEKVFLPYYNCPAVKEAVLKMGCEVEYYNLDQDMMPLINNYSEKCVVIWSNYFGLATKRSLELVIQMFDKLIIDNAQAFFSEPIIKNNVFNAYSCRKFLGVPDGGYIIGKNITKRELEKDHSWMKMGFLFKQLEEGTNSAYSEYLKNEESLQSSFLGMSILTKRLLHNINYDDIIKKRRRNFNTLSNELRAINDKPIEIIDKEVPFVYPLFTSKENFRDYLLNNNIYIPTWWRHLWTLDLDNDSQEFLFSHNLFPVPIDQRYSAEDMFDLSKIIKRYLL